MDLGARPWRRSLRVSVPQALPGIVAAAMLGFALSMDEFILTFLVTGSTDDAAAVHLRLAPLPDRPRR